MFAIGLLLVLGILVAVLGAVSLVFPAGKPRVFFVLCMVGAAAALPFVYRLSPSYRTFLEFCDTPGRTQIQHVRPVDYMPYPNVSSSDCKKGPALVANRAYRGFDCLLYRQSGPVLMRYTKTAAWNDRCGLECFDATPIEKAEAPYEWKLRQGAVDGRNLIVTYDTTRPDGFVQYGPEGAKFFFIDDVIWSEGVELAHARDYTYRQYGDGWAKVLGMSSGSAPSLRCRVADAPLDLRDVFPPKG